MSEQFLRGFVVSANLRDVCWSFCKGKGQSPQISAILDNKCADISCFSPQFSTQMATMPAEDVTRTNAQKMRRQISKSWLAKFPLWTLSRRPRLIWALRRGMSLLSSCRRSSKAARETIQITCLTTVFKH